MSKRVTLIYETNYHALSIAKNRIKILKCKINWSVDFLLKTNLVSIATISTFRLMPVGPVHAERR